MKKIFTTFALITLVLLSVSSVFASDTLVVDGVSVSPDSVWTSSFKMKAEGNDDTTSVSVLKFVVQESGSKLTWPSDNNDHGHGDEIFYLYVNDTLGDHRYVGQAMIHRDTATMEIIGRDTLDVCGLVEGQDTLVYVHAAPAVGQNGVLMNKTGSLLVNIASEGSVVQVGCSNAVFPVEYEYFQAFKNDGDVILDWATTQEINSSHFLVERSNNGVDFTSLGGVSAAGMSDEEVKYQFRDDTPPSQGMIYYRLKQVDLDGQFSYSSTVQVFVEDDSPAFAVINNGESNPVIVGELEGLTIRTITGVTLPVCSANPFKGLAAGIYFLQNVTSGESLTVLKI